MHQHFSNFLETSIGQLNSLVEGNKSVKVVLGHMKVVLGHMTKVGAINITLCTVKPLRRLSSDPESR